MRRDLMCMQCVMDTTAKKISFAANGICSCIPDEHSFKENEHGGYVWGIEVGPLSGKNHVANISHSAITIHFIMLAYESKLAFNSGDIEKVIITIKRLLADGHAERYIDGTGDYAYEIVAGQYAFLARYDRETWPLCHDLLFGLYRVDITAKYFKDDWWGTVMLGIARLANYATL